MPPLGEAAASSGWYPPVGLHLLLLGALTKAAETGLPLSHRARMMVGMPKRHVPSRKPEERYRMRRLSDAEMAELIALARQGRKGPAAALDALWELILHEAEGLSLAEGTAAR